MGENGKEVVGELVRRLTGKRMVVSADLDVGSLNLGNIDTLAERLIQNNESAEGIHIVTNEEVVRTLELIRNEKIPAPVEVLRSSEYKPLAKEVEADYQIRGYDIGYSDGSINSFIGYFNDRLDRIRAIIKQRESVAQTLKDIESIKSYNDGKEICIIGMVRSKQITKNKNMLVELDDSTGSAKVVFMNRMDRNGNNLYDKATSIVYDEVIAVKGKISGELVIASDMVWPDIPIKRHKQVDEDIAIAFISDIHFGSRNFMERSFRNMVGWLNGGVERDRRIAEKVKYLMIGGDVADGIGVYPGQERDLSIMDMHTQYKILADYIEAIPDYIHVFIIPGNHDSVQRAEPQPSFPEELVEMRMSNVHLLPNPSYITVHGVDILSYHGTSLDSVISSIPGSSYSRPEKAMVEILKRRHLSPIYGGNVIVPSRKDNLVIDKIPDVLHMGHIHKVGMDTYHGVDIVNSGTWQARTDFQIRQGHIPTPCIMPVLEAKEHRFSNIDFGVKDEDA